MGMCGASGRSLSRSFGAKDTEQTQCATASQGAVAEPQLKMSTVITVCPPGWKRVTALKDGESWNGFMSPLVRTIKGRRYRQIKWEYSDEERDIEWLPEDDVSEE